MISVLVPERLLYRQRYMALDKDAGKALWQYNVVEPIGIGGPSIGQGRMLFAAWAFVSVRLGGPENVADA